MIYFLAYYILGIILTYIAVVIYDIDFSNVGVAWALIIFAVIGLFGVPLYIAGVVITIVKPELIEKILKDEDQD